MENKEELEFDIDDIGAILKSNRLKCKKSLEEVSAELCIRKIYLTALEEGDYETLPPVPYGVGYVRTYANYLGLSTERAVKLYKAAAEIEEQAKNEEKEIKPEVNKSNNKHIIWGIVALIVVYAAWQMCNVKDKKVNAPIPQQVESIADNSLEETGLEQKQDEEQNIEQEAEEENSTATDNIPIEEVSTSDTSVKAPANTVLENNKVEIRFNGESWVELRNKDKVYFQGVFHQGDVKTVDYTTDLFVSVGRPKNVEIYVKGVKKDHLAKRRKTNISVDSLE
ncbi:MAG: helix-turn-helix domain-containing protein [Alphaproteobacteria bacterium]|nr:helix-turn-helix domain-containing protein [Alphaproteobacteria bacterium]